MDDFSLEPVLVVVWQSGKNFQSRAIRILPNVESAFLGPITDALTRVDTASGSEYDPGDEQVDGECLRVSPDDVLDKALTDAIMPGASLQTISTEQLRGKPLYCYALFVRESFREPTILIRKTNPVTLATKSIVAQWIDDRLDRIELPILAFDSRFDVIVRDGAFYALSQDGFESLFKRSEVVLKLVPEWVEEIFGTLPVSDEAKQGLVSRASGNSRTRRKIQSILRKESIRNLTLDGFHKLAKDQLGEDHGLVEDGQIVINKSTEQEILYILNEDNHRGQITGTPFISQRKTERKPKPSQGTGSIEGATVRIETLHESPVGANGEMPDSSAG